MSSYVTFTIHAARAESWIRRVKEHYLGVAPTKCIVMDCDYTLPKPGCQKKLTLEERQRVSAIQLCIAGEEDARILWDHSHIRGTRPLEDDPEPHDQLSWFYVCSIQPLHQENACEKGAKIH
jgi:hypothetical protein